VVLPASLWADPDNLQWLTALQGRFKFQLEDIPALLDMVGRGNTDSWPEFPQHMLTLEGRLEEGGRIRARGNLSTGDNHLRLAPSQVRVALSGGRFEDAVMDVDLKLDVKELSRLARLFALPQMEGQLSGDITVGGSLKRPVGRAVLTGSRFAVRQVPLGGLKVVISADQSRITAERLLMGVDKDSLQFSGSYNIDRQILENVRLRFAIAQIKPYLGLWGQLPQTLQGDLKGALQAEGPLRTPAVQVQARSQSFAIDELVLSDIRLRAAHKDGSVQADNIQVRAFGGVLKTAGTLRYGADFKTFEADLTELFIKRKNAELNLLTPARIRFTASDSLQISDLHLAGQMGEIRIDGLLALEGTSDLNLQIERFQSTGWLAEFSGPEIEFEGLNARGRIGGVLSDPQVTLAGDVASLRSPFIPVPLSGSFDMAYSEGTLRVDRLTWSGKDGYRASARGILPLPCVGRSLLPADNLTIEAEVDLPDTRAANLFLKGAPILSGSLFARLNLTGSWQQPVGDLRFAAKDIVTEQEVSWLPPGPLQLSGEIGYRGDTIAVDNVSLNSPNLTVTGQGRWLGGITPAMLCRFEPEKLTGKVDFDAKVTAGDLGWVGSRFPQIRRIGGRLEADIRVRGPIDRPELSAAVRLNAGELRLQAELPALEAVDLKAHLTPAKIEIQQLQGLLGGSTVHLQGAVDDPMNENPVFNLRLWGENLLFYREAGLRVRADTDLKLQGRLQALALTGEVAITDGLYDRYIDWLGGLQGSRLPGSGKSLRLFSLPDPPLRDMRIDVKIHARHPFRVRSNLGKAELRPELIMSGTGVAPLLTGKILLDEADLRLPSGTVGFEQGLVRFTEDDPDRPELDMVGSARMLGYDITVLIEGPYDDPVVTLSSAPPLSNEDLLLLVLTGTPPSREGQTIDPGKRNLNVAVYIGRDLIQRWFKGESSTTVDSILDRFEAEVGRDITQNGEETLEARFRLREGIFRQKDTLYITGEKDVFDYYNAGVRLVFRFK
jgi:translocation and assembly module TamB